MGKNESEMFILKVKKQYQDLNSDQKFLLKEQADIKT